MSRAPVALNCLSLFLFHTPYLCLCAGQCGHHLHQGRSEGRARGSSKVQGKFVTVLYFSVFVSHCSDPPHSPFDLLDGLHFKGISQATSCPAAHSKLECFACSHLVLCLYTVDHSLQSRHCGVHSKVECCACSHFVLCLYTGRSPCACGSGGADRCRGATWQHGTGSLPDELLPGQIPSHWPPFMIATNVPI